MQFSNDFIFELNKYLDFKEKVKYRSINKKFRTNIILPTEKEKTLFYIDVEIKNIMMSRSLYKDIHQLLRLKFMSDKITIEDYLYFIHKYHNHSTSILRIFIKQNELDMIQRKQTGISNYINTRINKDMIEIIIRYLLEHVNLSIIILDILMIGLSIGGRFEFMKPTHLIQKAINEYVKITPINFDVYYIYSEFANINKYYKWI